MEFLFILIAAWVIRTGYVHLERFAPGMPGKAVAVAVWAVIAVSIFMAGGEYAELLGYFFITVAGLMLFGFVAVTMVTGWSRH